MEKNTECEIYLFINNDKQYDYDMVFKLNNI